MNNLREGHKFFMALPQVEQAAGALVFFKLKSYPHIPVLFLRDLFYIVFKTFLSPP